MRERLDNLIKEFNKVILFECETEQLEKNIFEDIIETDKNILIILTKPYKFMSDNISAIVISEEDAEKLRKLYATYEFADNFTIITETGSTFGSIFNFVKSGILSTEEAWRALLI